ncbi:MAG: uracil-DNA glycosylase family protein [Nitratireductor sp.]
MAEELDRLAGDIARCRACVEAPSGKPLPHEPRPVVALSTTARIAICGQAPGTRVHASGVPFSDPSGERLRDWMGIGPEVFYDASRIAIVPMGFCFPGLDAKGGDLPPRRECAPLWRDRIFTLMPQIELVLAVGKYAQGYHLGDLANATVNDTVANWCSVLAARSNPRIIPLPHPSWRNNHWISRNHWFSNELLPELKKQVRSLL